MSNRKINLKKVKEEREEIYKDMQALHNEADGNFTDEQQKTWEDKKADLQEKDRIIAREDTLAQMRAKEADTYRNVDDGERKEIEKFDFREFLLSVTPQGAKALGKKYGFYQEMHEEGQQEADRAGISTQGNGLLVPGKVLGTKNQKGSGYRGDFTIGTEGEDVVQTNLSTFIDKLNDRLILSQMGADFLTGLTGNIQWPKETNAPTFTWEGETDANAESTPTTGNVQMSPKRGGTFIDVSNQALRQTSPAISARFERQLLNAAQRGIESAGINGSGTAPEPEGILNTTGIGAADVGANGGAQTWANWVDNETNVAVDNADLGALGYLTNAKVRGEAKKIKIDAGSGQFLWPVNANEVNGYRVGVSNLVPSDLSKGTGTALSALIFGNFNDLIIGQWGGIEVLVDPYTQATSGITRMVLNVYVDVSILRAESFSATQDIVTA